MVTISWPKMCIGCGTHENIEIVSSSFTKGSAAMGKYGPATRQVTVGISAGLCPSCSAKSIARGNKGFRNYLILTFVFWIASIIAFNLSQSGELFTLTLMPLGFIIGILSMIPLRRANNYRLIKKDRFWDYIDISGNRLEQMLFSFSNNEYAEAFKQSNEALKSTCLPTVKSGRPATAQGWAVNFSMCCYGLIVSFFLMMIGYLI